MTFTSSTLSTLIACRHFWALCLTQETDIVRPTLPVPSIQDAGDEAETMNAIDDDRHSDDHRLSSKLKGFSLFDARKDGNLVSVISSL